MPELFAPCTLLFSDTWWKVHCIDKADTASWYRVSHLSSRLLCTSNHSGVNVIEKKWPNYGKFEILYLENELMQGTWDFTTTSFSRGPTSSYKNVQLPPFLQQPRNSEELGNSLSVFPVLCVVYRGNSFSESLVRELGEADVWVKFLICSCYHIHLPRWGWNTLTAHKHPLD
jgi:hypothetical protein